MFASEAGGARTCTPRSGVPLHTESTDAATLAGATQGRPTILISQIYASTSHVQVYALYTYALYCPILPSYCHPTAFAASCHRALSLPTRARPRRQRLPAAHLAPARRHP